MMLLDDSESDQILSTVGAMDDSAAVACEGLAKRFGSTLAIDEVSLAVAPGEIVALLGPSGCGKTTFLRLVAGFERPDAGTITIAGTAVAGDTMFVRPERRRVGFVFQDYALFPHLDVAGNVAFGLSDRSSRATVVDETLDLVGMHGLQRRYPHELSGGQQQRVALARALAPRPPIVLLDEPFSNLDADLRLRVRTEIRQILRRATTTAIFVTHDQEETFDIADRIAVMNAGRIEQVGGPEEIYHTPRTRSVADFVGLADFLPAEVTRGRLITEIGSFDVGERAVPEGRFEIMLRPEDVAIEQGNGSARVVARRFRGPVNLSTIELASGRAITAAHSSQHAFPIGERVEVRFDPDHLVLFDGDRRAGLVHRTTASSR